MRGTTAKIKYNLRHPLTSDMIAKAKISFKHVGKVILTKHTADCTIKDNAVEARLTREDTLKFPDDQYIKVQLEVETTSGDVLKTKAQTVYSNELLDDGSLL